MIGVLALAPGVGQVQAAGNVTAHTSYGDLIITGSQQDDEITIKDINSGVVRVTGRNGTTITDPASGQSYSYMDFSSFNQSLYVDLQGGNDEVHMGELQSGTGSAVQPTALEVPGDLDVDLGDGSDTVGMQAVEVLGNAEIRGGAGYDYVDDFASHMHNDFRVFLGDDGDSVRLQYTQVDGNLNIDGGRGYYQDTVELIRVNIGGDLEVRTWEGVSGLSFREVTVGGTMTINTGAGRDYVLLERVNAGELVYSGGTGDDGIEVRDSVIGTASFDGGPGEDALYLLGNNIEGTSHDNFERVYVK